MQKRNALLAAIRSAGNPMTASDLADWTDDTPDRVRALIAYHRGAFRIADWTRRARHIVALYGEADGRPDVPKPDALTGNEKAARYRESHRAILAAKARGPLAHPW